MSAVPEILRRYALSNPVTIGPREQLTAFDTANQSLAASGQVSLGIMSAASVASTPPLGQLGRDITLTAGQLMLIEKLSVYITAQDASGKLQVKSGAVYDTPGFLLQPLKANGSPLPYTFGAVVGDACVLSADPESPEAMIVDPDSTGLSGIIMNFAFGVMLVNTDGAAAHLYTRILDVHYRIVSGVLPGTPRIINLA